MFHTPIMLNHVNDNKPFQLNGCYFIQMSQFSNQLMANR